MPVALVLTQEDVSTLICADKLGNIVLISSYIGLLVELRAAVLFGREFDIEKVFFILLPMIVNKQVIVHIVDIGSEFLCKLQKRNRKTHSLVHAENKGIVWHHQHCRTDMIVEYAHVAAIKVEHVGTCPDESGEKVDA